MNDTTLLVRATLALYSDAAREATRALFRNTWIVALPPLYAVVLGAAQQLAGGLGFAGGLLVFLLAAAVLSSYATVLAEAVGHERIRVSELPQSFGRFLPSVVSVLFIFWIIGLLLAMILDQNPTLVWLAIAINLGLFLLCNPLPEVVYQGTRDGLGAVDEAVQFMRQNAVEWLLPLLVIFLPRFAFGVANGLVAMATTGPMNALDELQRTLLAFLPPLGDLGQILVLIGASALLAWIMLFRGFLFRALAQSGRRQRIFGARMRGL